MMEKYFDITFQNQTDLSPSPDSHRDNPPTTAALAYAPQDAQPYECKLPALSYVLGDSSAARPHLLTTIPTQLINYKPSF